MSTELHDSFAKLLELTRRTWRHRDFVRDAGLAEGSLSRGETFVLAEIIRNAPVRPSDLASMLDLDRSIVSRQVDNLIRSELVARMPDPSDGRAALLEPTTSGRTAWGRIRTVRREWLDRVLTTLEPDDVAELGRLLPALVEAIEGVEPGTT